MEKYNKFNFDDDDLCSFEYDELEEIVKKDYKILPYDMLPTFEGWVFSHMEKSDSVSINYSRSTFEIIKNENNKK